MRGRELGRKSPRGGPALGANSPQIGFGSCRKCGGSGAQSREW